MTKIIKEFYACCRCKKELLDYKESKYRVCDGINHYFYDLCDDCRKEYETYTNEVTKYLDKIEQVTEKRRFGKYMFDGKE